MKHQEGVVAIKVMTNGLLSVLYSNGKFEVFRVAE